MDDLSIENNKLKDDLKYNSKYNLNENNGLMVDRLEKYESFYVNCSWLFIAAGFLRYLIYLFDSISRGSLNEFWFNNFEITASWIIFSCFFLLLKRFLIKKKIMFSNTAVYVAIRAAEILLITFAVVSVKGGKWFQLIIIFPIFITSLSKGASFGLAFTGLSYAFQAVYYSIGFLFPESIGVKLDGMAFTNEIFYQTFHYIIIALFAVICGKIYANNIENERRNSFLLEELDKKYKLLAEAWEEIKNNYGRLQDTNARLEEANKKLTGSVAEFYTLQQINRAISSIFDVRELLKFVNDVIIGVMGVSNSTVLLYDEKKGGFELIATSIAKSEEIDAIKNNINGGMLIKIFDSGMPLVENYMVSGEYEFIMGRDVNSFICMPLTTKSRKFGLVLIEHKYANAFDERDVRLVEIIGKQVGIALENAELYQRLQETATVDCLTGVYNRLYFQEMLEKEFKNAALGGYSLSLAIFDVDYFKRFNDTFGHLFGDKVLKYITRLVKENLDKGGIIARFGGEEFVVLFPETDLMQAYEKVEEFRKMIADAVIKDETVTASVTVSFGVSSYPECAGSETELVRTADDALYAAKASGRNCTVTAAARNRQR